MLKKEKKYFCPYLIPSNQEIIISNKKRQEFDDEIVSIDSQTDGMSHNEFNDIIDSLLNSKGNDDKDDYDD